jgi:hypothetical protein
MGSIALVTLVEEFAELVVGFVFAPILLITVVFSSL